MLAIKLYSAWQDFPVASQVSDLIGTCSLMHDHLASTTRVATIISHLSYQSFHRVNTHTYSWILLNKKPRPETWLLQLESLVNYEFDYFGDTSILLLVLGNFFIINRDMICPLQTSSGYYAKLFLRAVKNHVYFCIYTPLDVLFKCRCNVLQRFYSYSFVNI